MVQLIAGMRCDEDKACDLFSGPGFTLPINLGDLDPAITRLNLAGLNLGGEHNGADWLAVSQCGMHYPVAFSRQQAIAPS